MKPLLFLDLETYSDVDIKKAPLDLYASKARMLMCSYAFATGPIMRWEEGQPGLEDLHELMRTHTCIAWNVAFERTLIGRLWGLVVEWLDAMVVSLYCGLPAALKDANRTPYFATEAETSKESGLITLFCKPAKDGIRKDRTTHPEEWAAFGAYCDADVHDTRMIYQWLVARFDIPERVWATWRIDQLVNQRGVPVDRFMVYQAYEEAQRLQLESADALKALTGLENPNSPAQLLAWVRDRGYPYTGLGKELVQKALKEDPGELEYVDD